MDLRTFSTFNACKLGSYTVTSASFVHAWAIKRWKELEGAKEASSWAWVLW